MFWINRQGDWVEVVERDGGVVEPNVHLRYELGLD